MDVTENKNNKMQTYDHPSNGPSLAAIAASEADYARAADAAAVSTSPARTSDA